MGRPGAYLTEGRHAHELRPVSLEREGRAARVRCRSRKVGEHGPEGPADLLVHVGEQGEKPLGQVRERHEQHAPHPAERVHVVRGTVRDRGAAKSRRHVGQTVRREARQRDAGERERVDPGVAHRRTAGNGLHERAVKGGVVSKDGTSAHELGERANGRHRVGRADNIGVGDAGQPLDLWRDGRVRPHEGLKALRDLAAGKARGGDLYETAVLEREARGLRVENDDVLLERTKVARFGALG